ncbi:MAG: hypothetical protein LQ337_007111 [Flavoplaca oasis]|nr:MAG: hypothetical protein LQ337_007111 [Flavoplaca oasis]
MTSVAYCAVIPTPNLLLPGLPHVPTETNFLDFHCAHSPQWKDTRLFDIGDCFGTFHMMLDAEGVEPFAREVRKEFKTRKARSNLPPGDAVLTPRKYVVGTCTLAILMRVEVRPEDFPAVDGRSTITNDVSSFKSIAHAASLIYDLCGKPLKSPGWASLGERNGMAVAFWGTGSTIDRHYGNLRPVIALPSLPPADGLQETA